VNIKKEKGVVNSIVFLCSRMLVSLASEGQAPKIFARVNKRGIPTNAVLVTLGLGMISLATSFVSPDKLFIWLISIAGFNTLLGWFSSLLAHLYFRKWLVAHGGKVEKLKFKMGASYPLPTILGLILLVAIAFFTSWSPDTRFSFFIGLPMLLLYFAIGTYMHKKGKMEEPDYKKYLYAHINNTKIQ